MIRTLGSLETVHTCTHTDNLLINKKRIDIDNKDSDET